MDTSKAAAAMGRAGRGASKIRGDANHYRAIRAKRHPLGYISDERPGKGWVTYWWDAHRSIYVEGGTHRTKRMARAALRTARAEDRARR